MIAPLRLFWASALALASLQTASAAPGAIVVFNEIQYNPPGQTEDGEWVELFNQQGIKVDVSGWRIAGLGYTFPQGTFIDPGDYLLVRKTAPAPGELGPFTGSIDNGGERLRLYNQSDRLMDEIDFADNAPWPAGADGSGATLAKREPYAASGAPENWGRSDLVGGTPGAENFPGTSGPPPISTSGLLALTDVWRFNESGADLGAGWASSAHAVGGDWEDGPGWIASNSESVTPGTTLSFPPFNNPYVVTYYFEREFDVSAAQLAALQSLNLRHGFDDGAVIYINGVEALRIRMDPGPVTAATFANDDAEIDALSPDVPIPSGALVAGSNRISVEIHQVELGSPDAVFGLELDAEIAGAVPGAGPQIVLNEVPPASAPSFWVELLNGGVAAVELGGLVISAGADPLREYTLPAGQLDAGGLLLLDEATLGFRPLDGEKLFVYDVGNTAVLDARQVTGRLRGRSGDDWLYPSAATPGAPNTFQLNSDVVISEIAYNPPSLPAMDAVTQDVSLFAIGETWRFNDTDENLPAGWAASAHAVGGNWSSGGAPIGRESSTLPLPLVTDLVATYESSTRTYYFETEFTVDPADAGAFTSLEVTHQIDDGAVFYINGVEVGRFNMLDGDVDPETLASPSVGNAALRSTSVPSDALVAGMNRFSVEVHQSSNASSDMVFAAALDGVVELSPAQPFRNSDNQWVEIANNGASAVDLGGWQFNDGIDFDFPANTMLAPGEHACVARDTALFTAAYPGARLLGEFSGSLSRSGERLHLRDANRNPVDTVRYYEGGAWPGDADGGGKTLELRDLDADNAVGGAWAASDETSRTAWRTYSYTELASTRRGPDNQWREFNMGMMGSGEILIDDITLTGDLVSIRDPGFDDDPSANAPTWRMRGNHRHSEIIDDPDQPGNKVLRLVASGPTEHMHNQIETTLNTPDNEGVSSSTTYTISFRARWVSGSSQLHSRLYFNRCANVNVLDRPSDPGTPSAPNSTAEQNIGPTFTGLKHDPPVPAPNEATTISVAASDPDGVGSMTLFYSVNGGAFQSIAMGATGGRYQAGIPGQAVAARVQFYIEGSDSAGASAFFPPEGPDSRAMYRVDDGLAATNGWHNFRILLTAADVAFQHNATEVMSNDRLPCTVIDREGQIYYGCRVRLKSSERGRNNLNRVGYNVRFPADGLFRGCHDTVALDRSEGQSPGQRELLFDMMISNSGGVLSRYYDFVKLLAPNSALTGGATLQIGRYDEIFLDAQFDQGGDGRLFEYELIYYPTSANGAGQKLPQPDTVTGVRPSDLGDDPEYYRWFFLNKINREADDFDPMIAYCKKMSQGGSAFDDGLEDVVDVDDWLRGMAYGVLSGAGDNAAANSQHNGLYYAKPDGRIMFLPHDMDFAFSTTRGIYANGECNRLTNVGSNPGNEQRRRIYLGHLHDIISTTYNRTYMSIWSNHFNDLDPTQDWNVDLDHCVDRSNNVLSQINGSISPIAFNVTTPSPLTVASSTATVSGDGWVDVREIRIQGNPEPLPVTWTDNNSWQVVVPAPPGQNTVTLEAVNFSGVVIGTETITIDNTTPFEPATADNIVVSELMYHPADGAGEEFIELLNIGSVLVDLTGTRFIAGIDYDVPVATTLDPGERLVISESQFLNSALANGGERLQLIGAGGATIKDFTYHDKSPWPEAADGAGYSLVLVDPLSNPDHGLAGSWRVSTLPGGNPGADDSVVFTGDPDADDDNDGLSAFLEHALGSSDAVAAPSGVLIAGSPGALVFSYPRNLAADDVSYVVESSEDLVNWVPADGSIQSDSPLGDGRAMVEFALSSATPRLAVRLRVASK